MVIDSIPERIDVIGHDIEGLQRLLQEHFEVSSFRSKQLFSWLYRKMVSDFSEMTDLSKSFREELQKTFRISRLEKTTSLESKDGSRKYLFKLSDGSEIESVLICQPKRYTLCVSSQVGCAIGCKFCKTAQMGLKRNLTAAEIVGQVIAVREDVLKNPLSRPDETFQNIVFMGMGEPLHNKTNVITAVKILNDRLGLNFSGRKITVSTSGLVPAIKEFGDSGARANLAVSLNATTNEIREEIMPINKRWPLESLLEALRNYPLKPSRRITLEYVMLAGVNDTDEDLRRLPIIIKDIPSKINLIPYNANTGLGFAPPSSERVYYWQKQLLAAGLNSSIRWSKCEDISAACGQLATEYQKKKAKKAELNEAA